MMEEQYYYNRSMFFKRYLKQILFLVRNKVLVNINRAFLFFQNKLK